MKTYAVQMQKGNKTWTSYTQANSKFDAMLQMNKKHGCGAIALSAKPATDCKFKPA
ncbi:hypothetical protein pA_gene0066 [Vibrio phage 13VT501A]|nr:hypothetical protein pA_gene0066 [Vibrio phage 13VT501A]